MTSEDGDSVRSLKDIRDRSSSLSSDQKDSSSSYEDLSGTSWGSTPSPPAFGPLETLIASDYLSGTQKDSEDLDARGADEAIEDLGQFEAGSNTRDAFEDSRQLEGGINTREADEALEDFSHFETGINARKVDEKTCTDFGQLEACIVSKDVDTREADEALEVIDQLEVGINTLESDEAFEEFDKFKAGINTFESDEAFEEFDQFKAGINTFESDAAFEEFDQFKAGIASEDFDGADNSSENSSPIEVSSSSDDGFSPAHVASPLPRKRSTLAGYPSLSQRYIRRLRITPLQYRQLLQSYMDRVRAEVFRMTGGAPRRAEEAASPKCVYTGPLYFVQESPGSPPTYLLPPVELLVMMRNRLFFPDDTNLPLGAFLHSYHSSTPFSPLSSS